MRLFVDSNTHLSLKALLAQQISKIESIEIVDLKVEPRTYSTLSDSPLLELDDGTSLFSPNTICSYLMVKGEQSIDHAQVDAWLEWESSCLEPCLCRILTSSYQNTKVDPTLLETFTKCLNKLDLELSDKKFLYKNELTAADVVVWCCIYPIAVNKSTASTYLDAFKHLIKWFDNLAKQDVFKNVIKKYYNNSTADIFKKSILSLPNPPVANDQSSKDDPSQQGDNRIPREKLASEAEEEHEIHLTAEEIAESYQSWLHGRINTPQPREIVHPLLPRDDDKNILITSALPYVNNVPHLGNIIGCVLSADAFARFCRLRNYNTLYISGTDEYGTATETKAIEEGLTPREICDKYYKLHSEIYEWFQISFDFFGRTTTQQQTQISQDIFWRLHKAGYLLEETNKQLQCEKCDRFLADRFVEGICPLCGYDDARGDQCDSCGKLINAIELKSPRCKLCQATPIAKNSDHLYLDLPKLESKVEQWFVKSSESGLWTSNAKTIAHSWLKEGLKPRCITRDLKWGTPVPLEGYTDKVFYVWFDAPIGYLSITANYTDEWEKWWKNPDQVQLYQFMAKDNVPFHSIIFPSSELGADDNYTIVNHLIATEYLNYEDGKFSKSRGVGVFGNEAKEVEIPSDIWRFYLLYTRPETQDSVFCWSDLMLKNNSELLNNLGNFINRGLAFLVNNFGGVIPEMNLNEDDKLFLGYINNQLKAYIDVLERVKIRKAVRHILNISRRGNQFIQGNKPWVLVKGSNEEKARAGSLIGLCANVSCLLSVLIQPYMPSISRTIQEQLVAPADCNVLTSAFVCYLPTGHKIGKPAPLFQKLESQRIDELKKKFSGKQSRETTPNKPEKAVQYSIKNDKIVSNQTNHLTIEELQENVTSQANLVRKLKTEKADKSVIDREVKKLLELKVQFASASGVNPTTINSTKKEKKGKR